MKYVLEVYLPRQIFPPEKFDAFPQYANTNRAIAQGLQYECCTLEAGEMTNNNKPLANTSHILSFVSGDHETADKNREAAQIMGAAIKKAVLQMVKKNFGPTRYKRARKLVMYDIYPIQEVEGAGAYHWLR